MTADLIGKILAMILGAILICSVLVGANRGLFLGLFSMIKNLIVIIAAVGVAPVVAKRLPEAWPAKEGIGYAIAFFVSIIVVNLVGRLIREFDDVPGISGLNRFGGAVLGGVVGFFMIWTLLALLGCLQEIEWCAKVVEAARQNSFVMWFQDTSPLPGILKMFDFPVL